MVAIIPTGDEVIEIDRPLQPGQVRNSAAHALEALVTTYGGVPRRLPVVGDTIEETRAALLSCLDCDLIVTIGGVSMGDYDLVRNVLGAEGEIDFWRIRMRPGKPLAFGHIEASANAEDPNAEAVSAVTPAKASSSVIPKGASSSVTPKVASASVIPEEASASVIPAKGGNPSFIPGKHPPRPRRRPARQPGLRLRHLRGIRPPGAAHHAGAHPTAQDHHQRPPSRRY